MSSTDLQTERAAQARRRRSNLLMAVVAALCVLVPFLFWKQTWFGEVLTDDQLGQYLNDTEKPRHIQQALVQVQQRIERGDSSVQHWYPRIAALHDSPITELRVTLAWMLGADTRSELFHETLIHMLGDQDILVRRNAALSLVRFGDAAGREELLKMLQPYTVLASEGGTLRYRAEEGRSLESGAVLARLEKSSGATVDVHSPVPGKVLRRIAPEGSSVNRGDELVVLSPGEEHAWEALRALFLMGRAEDLPVVEEFTRDRGYSDNLREQASLTAAAIRKRTQS